MKKIIPFFIMICCLLAVSSCSYDNFEEPKATLTGRAIYNGEAVGVRSEVQSCLYSRTAYVLHGSITGVCCREDGRLFRVPFSMVYYKLVA